MQMEEEIIREKLIKYRKQQLGQDIDSLIKEDVDVSSYIMNIYNNLNILEHNQVNSSVRYIEEGKGIKGRLFYLIKRVIRRLGLFYVQPVCDQQTAYNIASTLCVEKLLRLNINLNNKINELQKENQMIKEYMEKIESGN